MVCRWDFYPFKTKVPEVFLHYKIYNYVLPSLSPQWLFTLFWHFSSDIFPVAFRLVVFVIYVCIHTHMYIHTEDNKNGVSHWEERNVKHTLYWIEIKGAHVKSWFSIWMNTEINKDINAYVLLAAEGGWEQCYFSAVSTRNAQILVSKHFSLFKGTRAPWRRGLFQGERKEQMNVGYLIMPESKDVLKNDGDISENIQTNLKGYLLGELR